MKQTTWKQRVTAKKNESRSFQQSNCSSVGIGVGIGFGVGAGAAVGCWVLVCDVAFGAGVSFCS